MDFDESRRPRALDFYRELAADLSADYSADEALDDADEDRDEAVAATRAPAPETPHRATTIMGRLSEEHRATRTAVVVILLPLVLLALGTLAPAELDTTDLWSSPSELRQFPIQGPAWEAVLTAANESTSHPDIADQDDPTNIRVLAAAIVYARIGRAEYREKVTNAIQRIVSDGRPDGRTLAWAREVGAYALAADLVRFRTDDFERWLRNVAERWHDEDGLTLRAMFQRRPNNWGSHALGTLCAIYAYLGDVRALQSVRRYWVRGVRGPNPGFSFGADRSWHYRWFNLRIINPKAAVKNGVNIDGFFPDDMRRGGPFSDPPIYTNYAWETLQGIVMAARVLDRVGLSIWDIDDQAIYRAVAALEDRLGGPWQASGDDRWMLPFFDAAYGTTWSNGRDVWGAGKNTGWAYVLGPPAPTPAPPPAPTPAPTN